MNPEQEGISVKLLITPDSYYPSNSQTASQVATVVAARPDKIIFTLGPNPLATEVQTQVQAGKALGQLSFAAVAPQKSVTMAASDGSGSWYSLDPVSFVQQFGSDS